MIHTKLSDPTFIQQVNELIAINNERFKSYSRAMLKTQDEDFRSLCAQNKERTVHFNVQLIRFLVQNDQVPEILEDVYPLNRALFSAPKGVNRKACFWWDTFALKAYRRMMRDLQDIPKEIKRVLQQQQSILENDQRYSGIAL